MKMSDPKARLSTISRHLQHPTNSESSVSLLPPQHEPSAANRNRASYHTLSPTFFLPRAAAIEPEAQAIYHVGADGAVLHRSYTQLADRARGLAYYLRRKALRRVGVLCPNTPAFLESIFGIAAAGGVIVAINYRLSKEDIAYIFQHADVDAIIVDREFVPLLNDFRAMRSNVRLIVDNDTSSCEEELNGPFDMVVQKGLKYDEMEGNRGWETLEGQARDEEDIIALAYTSGTTARPKGVEYTHRGCYLAALGNAIESGLNLSASRCRYLWTLPMFHAMGWTFPYAVTAVRGTHYCLRKIDYPHIWYLLKHEQISHFNAAPTVNTLLCNNKEAVRLSQPVRVTVAASPPTPYLFKTMTDLNLHPIHVYGLTETYGPITKGYQLPSWETLPEEEKFRKLARQGHGFLTSLPARVVKMTTKRSASVNLTQEHVSRDPNESGEAVIDVARNGREIGEVALVGNICAKGYYKDEEATKRLFTGGVLHTGDLAVWHPDGAVQILDRAKDIIISGGENISSVALESMLARHPLILEAGVIGVPDKRWGERTKAYITVKDEPQNDASASNGSNSDSDKNKKCPADGQKIGARLRGQDVVEWAKRGIGEGGGGISSFMVPREVEIVAELPKTATGKVKKGVLREWARGKNG